MSIIEIESTWRETGIICPKCGEMTYSDGAHRPQCTVQECLAVVPDERIGGLLITLPGCDCEVCGTRFVDDNPTQFICPTCRAAIASGCKCGADDAVMDWAVRGGGAKPSRWEITCSCRRVLRTRWHGMDDMPEQAKRLYERWVKK